VQSRASKKAEPLMRLLYDEYFPELILNALFLSKNTNWISFGEQKRGTKGVNFANQNTLKCLYIRT
jgi:hypothetical protein